MHDVKTKQQAIAEAESTLVQQVRLQENVSRVELARQLNLAPSTVGLYVDRLIDEGFLREGHKARRASGRPPTILELNPQAGKFIGVDFDARLIAVTTVDFSQNVLQQHQQAVRASETANQVLEKIEKTIATVTARRPLLGIGLAVPGTIDSRRGVGLHYKYIRGWENVPLVERLKKRFRVPIYLENNIRAMALAERWFGEARRVDHFVCLGIRSGIGAGVVVEGRLHRGHDDLAGEIGGWPCEMGDTAGTNEVVTLEQVASVRAILARLTAKVRAGASTSLVLKRKQITLEAMLCGANDADPLVLQTLDRAAQAVGRAISQLSLLLNPKKVIIAGPLAALPDTFIKPIAEIVHQLVPSQHVQPPQIVGSQFGVYGGALGAAALAVHRWKPAR